MRTKTARTSAEGNNNCFIPSSTAHEQYTVAIIVHYRIIHSNNWLVLFISYYYDMKLVVYILMFLQ